MKHSIRAVSAILATVATMAATGGLLGAGSAQADPATGGKVIAKGGLNVRNLPSTVGASVEVIPNGRVIPIGCKVHGTPIDGNDRWYSVLGYEGSGEEWVSARYVRNLGAPGWCGNGKTYTGMPHGLVNLRYGPTKAEALAGSLAVDRPVSLVCKLKGETVNGNSWWYETADGFWVSARYVRNVGKSPVYCD
jgi:Bacterial SH3 domain